MDGTILDMIEVYNDLDEYILRSEYDVRAFGYDPYNAREFVERWTTDNGPYGIHKVIRVHELSQFHSANSRVWLRTEGLSSIKSYSPGPWVTPLPLRTPTATERS